MASAAPSAGLSKKVVKMLKNVYSRNPSLDLAGQDNVALQAGVSGEKVREWFRERASKQRGKTRDGGAGGFSDSSDDSDSDHVEGRSPSLSGEFAQMYAKGVGDKGAILTKQVPSFIRACLAARNDPQRLKCAQALSQTSHQQVLARLHNAIDVMEALLNWLLSASEVAENRPNGNVELLVALLAAFDTLPVTLDTLRKLPVGKAVARLKKSGIVRVKARATKLVEKWAKNIPSKVANSSAPRKTPTSPTPGADATLLASSSGGMAPPATGSGDSVSSPASQLAEEEREPTPPPPPSEGVSAEQSDDDGGKGRGPSCQWCRCSVASGKHKCVDCGDTFTGPDAIEALIEHQKHRLHYGGHLLANREEGVEGSATSVVEDAMPTAKRKAAAAGVGDDDSDSGGSLEPSAKQARTENQASPSSPSSIVSSEHNAVPANNTALPKDDVEMATDSAVDGSLDTSASALHAPKQAESGENEESSEASGNSPPTKKLSKGKTVTWNDSELTTTKYFLSEDMPQRGFPSFSDAKRHEFETSEAEAQLEGHNHPSGRPRAAARIPWRPRLLVGSMPDYAWPTSKLPEGGQNTPEAVTQRQREATLGMPVTYFNSRDVPSSPGEPDGEPNERRNNLSVEGQIAADAGVPPIPWINPALAAPAAAEPQQPPAPVVIPTASATVVPVTSPPAGAAPVINTSALAQLLGNIGAATAPTPTAVQQPASILAGFPGVGAGPSPSATAVESINDRWGQSMPQPNSAPPGGSGFGGSFGANTGQNDGYRAASESRYAGAESRPYRPYGDQQRSDNSTAQSRPYGQNSRYESGPPAASRYSNSAGRDEGFTRYGNNSRDSRQPDRRERDPSAPGFVSKIPCKYFFNDGGNCRWGAECQFSHDPEVYARNGGRLNSHAGAGRNAGRGGFSGGRGGGGNNDGGGAAWGSGTGGAPESNEPIW